MKKNFLKKTAAIVMSAAMVLALGVNAFAANSLIDGEVGAAGTSLTDNAIEITKDIVLYNTAGSAVYEPNITYTYTVTPAAGGATIDDGTNQAVVKAGEADALVTESPVSVTFEAEAGVTHTAAATGTVLSDTFALAFDPAAFPSAGVYRYQIAETTDGRTAAGIVSGNDYESDRYLDVYVMNDNGAKSIYGFVLFEGNASTDIDDEFTGKSNGWVQKTAGSETDVDNYKTTNVTIEDHITGTLADMGHNFPFYVSLTNAAITSAPTFLVGGTATALPTSGTYTIGSDDKNSAIKLGDGETIEIVGIPAGFTAAVKEYNDTADAYKVTIKNEADSIVNDFDATRVAADAPAVTGDVQLSATDAAVFAFTNDLDAVSPTGVIMRFAPFAFILAAGIVLMMVSRKKTNAG